MRLVGATDSFIRAPFLLEGFLKGALGGLLALLLTWLAYQVVGQYFTQAAYFDPFVAGVGVMVGALIGLTGSAVSVGRHLRQV